SDSHEVLIVPVDNYGHTVLFSEMKIENVDANFRTVREPKGVPYHLESGEYKVKVFLPNLRMKTLTLKVSGESAIYKICVEERDTPPMERIAEPVQRKAEPGVAGGSSWMQPKSEYRSERPFATTKKKAPERGEPRVEPRFHVSFPVA